MTDDRAEQLRRKGANLGCPACGKSEWHGGDAIVHLLVVKDVGDLPNLGGQLDSGGSQVVPVVCGNCGFVRLHDPRYLDD